MKVRNFALTILGAVLAGAAFSIKEQVGVGIWGIHIPLAALVLLSGAAVWFAFYLMDRHWYHNLLLGSVAHGMYIEKRYHARLPELGLAAAIGAASSTMVGQWKIRSSAKLNLFYLFGTLLLVVAAIGSFFIVGKKPEPSNATQSSTMPNRPRLSAFWREAIDADWLLLASPFADTVRRTTKTQAQTRNEFVAAIATAVLYPSCITRRQGRSHRPRRPEDR